MPSQGSERDEQLAAYEAFSEEFHRHDLRRIRGAAKNLLNAYLRGEDHPPATNWPLITYLDRARILTERADRIENDAMKLNELSGANDGKD